MYDISDFINIKKIIPQNQCQQEFELILKYLCKCFNINSDGLYLEFGVYHGTSINRSSSILPNQQFYGFDCFEGLPEEWDNGKRILKKGSLSTNGILPPVNDNVTLIKGLFQDTLLDWWRLHYNHIVFLNIDSDIYSSAKFVLDTLNNGINKNTIIRFDEFYSWGDFFYHDWENHEWKAFTEWIDEYDREILPLLRDDDRSVTMVVTK